MDIGKYETVELFQNGLTDDLVKEQAEKVMSFGRRTIAESFLLGEMLVKKKGEKKHGEWLPFLDWLGIGRSTASRLITAFNEQDNFVDGMTFSELAKDTKLPDSGNIKKLDPFADWSDEEKALKDTWEGGATIVINMNVHKHLLQFANNVGKFQKIDRGTNWGNPFNLNDGTRDEICNWYEENYYPLKRSLHTQIKNLKGKVLGCHCFPEKCHGETLIKIADEN